MIRNLSKSTIHYSLGNLFHFAMGFLLLPVFTRYLTPGDYGVLSMLTVFTASAVALLSLGLGTSIALCHARDKTRENTSRTIGSALFVLSAMGTLVVVIGCAFPDLISHWLLHDPQYATLIRYTAVTTFMYMVAIPLMSFLQLEHKAFVFLKLSIGTALFSALIRYFLIVVLERGARGAVEGLLLGQTFTVALFLAYVLYCTRLTWRKQEIAYLLKTGIPLIPSFAALLVLQRGNVYVLQHVRGLADVGIYTVGHSAGNLMEMLVSGFTTAWTPFFLAYMDKRSEARAMIQRAFTYYVFCYGFLVLAAFLFAKSFVLIMTAPAFYGAYRVIGFVALARFFVGVFHLLLPAMYYKQEVRFVPAIQGLAAVVGMCFNFVLVYFFGFVGGAIGLTVGMFLMAAFQYGWNRLRSGYLQATYASPRTLLIAGLYIGVAALTLISRDLPLTFEFGLAITLGSIVFVSGYHLISPDERHRLKQFIAERFGLPQRA